MPVTAFTFNGSRSSQPDQTTTSINSYNRSLNNQNVVNETWISTNSIRTTNCSLIISAFDNLSKYIQQHICIVPLNETRGHRRFDDYAFNKTREAAFNIAAYILGIFCTSSCDTVLKHLHECIKYSHQQTFLHTSNETAVFVHKLSKDNPQTEPCIRNMNVMKAYAEALNNIITLAVNIPAVESLNSEVQNIRTSFTNGRKYDTGKMALQYFDKYLRQLESVVQHIKDLNTTSSMYNLSVIFDSSWVNLMLTYGRWESELLRAKQRHREVSDLFLEVKVLEVFRRYVDPTVYCAIVAVGVVWNGILLFIFFRHRQFWTSANIMIFNLAGGDIMSIVLNVPVFYFAHYHIQHFQNNEYLCKFFITLRPFSVALSALSVTGLSILRYGATRTPFNAVSCGLCEVSNRKRPILYVLAVWGLAIVLALPYVFALKFNAGKCFTYGEGYTAQMVAISEFVLYCVVLPCIMVWFNVLTVKSLRDSARNMASAMQYSGQDLIRNRSARVLTVLIVVFLVSYIPHHLWRVLYRWFELDIWEVTYRCIDKITYYLLFANCCFNPISLYGVSRRFRGIFNYYFLYLYDRHCKRNSDSNLQRSSSFFVIDIAKDQTTL